jgi:P-type ATPase transporter.
MSKSKYNTAEAKFINPTNVEDEASIAKIYLYKRSTQKRIAYWIFFFLTGGIIYLLQKWSVAIRLAIKNSKTSDVKEADRLIVEGSGNSPQMELNVLDGTTEYILVKDRNLYIGGEMKVFKVIYFKKSLKNRFSNIVSIDFTLTPMTSPISLLSLSL